MTDKPDYCIGRLAPTAQPFNDMSSIDMSSIMALGVRLEALYKPAAIYPGHVTRRTPGTPMEFAG
jgi:hypothetical protein